MAIVVCFEKAVPVVIGGQAWVPAAAVTPAIAAERGGSSTAALVECVRPFLGAASALNHDYPWPEISRCVRVAV